AAVGSISFDLPHAVLDGNVFRVLSRIFADPTNIASVLGKRHFADVANALLDKAQPGVFNQAMMELGAVLYVPKNPKCLVCPVSSWCVALQQGTQPSYPVKIVLRKPVQEQRTLFWIERDRRILAWRRPSKSRLMPGFWELPEREQLPGASPEHKLGSFRHGITFHKFVFDVWTAPVPDSLAPCEWIDLSELHRLPISTVLRKGARIANAAGPRAGTAQIATASNNSSKASLF